MVQKFIKEDLLNGFINSLCKKKQKYGKEYFKI
jgi:hypothetical protein